MFLSRCVVFCLSGLLKNHKRPIHRHLLLLFDYSGCERKVIEWHRAKLEKLDPLYRLQQAGLHLAAAREIAHAEGTSLLDSRYPALEEFSKIDWAEEVRIHGDILTAYKMTSDRRMQRLADAMKEYPSERAGAP